MLNIKVKGTVKLIGIPDRDVKVVVEEGGHLILAASEAEDTLIEEDACDHMVDIYLDDVGDQKISVIKAVRAVTQLGLK